MKNFISKFLCVVLVAACIAHCMPEDKYSALAAEAYTNGIDMTTRSVVCIDPMFGSYMKQVDENIYYSLCSVNAQTLRAIYGDYNTPMFNKACETINPCMAFATTWGEAGRSYRGVSLTTIMDFNPDTYQVPIDWITLSLNLEQVDSSWYLANAKFDYNSNENGHAYGMPNALLQIPQTGSRQTSEMTGLGVGPYQITSPDWNKWNLDNRVNPVWGYRDSLQKCGTAWITCGIEPISDFTVYACLSMGHQGGGIINLPFGRELINILNREETQDAFNRAGERMYTDLLERAYNKEVSLSDINVVPYLLQIESELGIDFSNYTGGVGRTNKGDYVAKHCLRYVFYKCYFTGGSN